MLDSDGRASGANHSGSPSLLCSAGALSKRGVRRGWMLPALRGSRQAWPDVVVTLSHSRGEGAGSGGGWHTAGTVGPESQADPAQVPAPGEWLDW